YARRLRPRAAYAMGLIHRWARLAARAPWLANAVTQTPALAPFAKWIGGIATQRHMPRFASRTFTRWFRERRTGRTTGGRVLLWPDTFNNHFRPQTAVAAVHVLEELGFSVAIPDRPLCCGRPLYDWGMIDQAKQLWRQTMASLRSEIERGT